METTETSEGASTPKPEIEIREILTPIDFSEGSRNALRYAEALAGGSDASLVLAHVVDFKDLNHAALRLGPVVGEKLEESVVAEAGEQLKQLADEELEPETKRSRYVHAGRTVELIEEVARASDADLMVVSTHSDRVVRHALLGSTAEKLVRHAPCPVLVVRDKEHEFVQEGEDQDPRSFSLKKILAPTDFSEESLKALRYALTLGRPFNAQIDLLHIVNTGCFGAGYAAVDLPAITEQVVDASKESLSELAEREIGPSENVIREVRVGPTAQTIAEVAREREIDLIVVSTHGNTGLKRMLLGSNAENIVRHAPCPVLVVRERERDFVKE